MKTLCLSLLFTVAAGATRLAALTAAATPTPSPTPTPAATPLPATEPEPSASPADNKDKADKMDGCCPMCQPGKDKESKAAPGPAADEQAVLKLEQDWCEAEARHDTAFLDKVETDNFVFTDSLGKVTGKADEIAEAKEGGDRIDFKLTDMKAHLHGDTVILTGQTTFVPPAGHTGNFSYRWTDIFVRQPGGEWKVAASQATALNQGKAESPDDE